MPTLSDVKLCVGAAAVAAAYCGSQRIYPAMPSVITTLQKIRTTSITAIRIRPRESGRQYLIVRNLEPANIAQIAFTDTTNNNYNAPTTGFTDINPNEEWYELSHQGQVWLRSKTNGQSVTCEIEVAVTRIQ